MVKSMKNLWGLVAFVLLTTFVAVVTDLGAAHPGFARHHDDVMDDSTGKSSMPERILLTRHAEKPDDEDNPDLTPAGFQRAERLPSYILGEFGRPDFIFASANSKKSSRPYETAVPLSKQCSVPIDTTFRGKDFEKLAEVLRHDNRFAGKFVVVFWHHGNIPAFAQALHARDGDYPAEWDSKVFNQVLQFDYRGKSRPSVQCLTEPF